MVFTKEEAGRKDCPELKDKCVSTDCMMWRWSTSISHYPPAREVAFACAPRVENGRISFREGCGERRDCGEARGYCGKAGKPEA
jgi:hypothetical protein